jgi:hypothetical protein
MNLRLYLTILRQSWLIILLVAGIAAGASLAVALIRVPSYTATARLLVTFSDPARVDIEDPLAYDVAAIVKGRPFGSDVAAALTSQGVAITTEEVMASLNATNTKREVFLSATSTAAELPIRLLNVAVTQLQSGGLRYWGAAPIVAQQPGISIVILDIPREALRSNGMGSIIREVGLRTLTGLAFGIVVVFVRYYLRNTHATE